MVAGSAALALAANASYQRGISIHHKRRRQWFLVGARKTSASKPYNVLAARASGYRAYQALEKHINV